MAAKAIEKIEAGQLIAERLRAFEIGDTVKVHTKIREGEKERIQIVSGIVIARDGGGATETFTVRRVAHGVGVERVFPLHSPYIAEIEVSRSAYVRRAKLYFLRDRVGKKATRLKDKIRR